MAQRREDLPNTLTLAGLIAASEPDVVLLDASGQAIGKAPMVETEGGELPAWHVFIANTSAPNRYDSIIDQNTWQLDNYRANPVILWMHDMDQDPLGRGEVWVANLGTPDACLMVRVWWNHKRERARDVCEQVEDGMLSAVSIRAMFGQRLWRDELPETDPRYKRTGWGRVLSYGDLEEISIVTVPGDPNALKQALLAALEPGRPAQTPAAPPPTPEPSVNVLRTLLLTRLSLGERTTDEALAAAVTERLDQEEARLASLRSALGLAEGADLPDDLRAAVLEVGRAGYVRADTVERLVAKARAAGAEAAENDPTKAALALVDAKLAAGAILPALAETYRKMAASDPATLTTILSARQPGSVVPVGEQATQDKQPPTSGAAVQLSAEQLAQAKRDGLTPEQMLAAVQKVERQRAQRRGES